jgi:hypothetical protein
VNSEDNELFDVPVPDLANAGSSLDGQRTLSSGGVSARIARISPVSVVDGCCFTASCDANWFKHENNKLVNPSIL